MNNKLVRLITVGAIVIALVAGFVTGSAAWGAGIGTFLFASARVLLASRGA